MEVTQKRRIVYTALSEHLPKPQVLQALEIWEKSHVNKSKFEINGFLTDCLPVEGFRQKKVAIYKSLIALMMSPDTPVLKSLLVSDVESYSSLLTNDRLSEEQKAYAQLLGIIINAMLTKISTADRQSVIAYLRQNHAIPTQLMDDSPLSERKQYIVADLKKAKQILNSVYVCLCEFIGPVRTDKLLSSVIVEVRQKYHEDPVAEGYLNRIFDK